VRVGGGGCQPGHPNGAILVQHRTRRRLCVRNLSGRQEPQQTDAAQECGFAPSHVDNHRHYSPLERGNDFTAAALFAGLVSPAVALTLFEVEDGCDVGRIADPPLSGV